MNKKVLIALFILVLLGSYIYKFVTKEKVDIVTSGKHEVAIQEKAYILANETITNYDTNKVLMPISEDLKRVSKGDIIGVYKNVDYDLKQKKIDQMDLDIKSKLMLNTNVYSNEIIEIENKVHEIITDINTKGSCIKMNDYKNKLDELAYKKAIVVSSLTPNGDEIKQLINTRNEYIKSIKNVSDNLKSEVAGVVVYKLDGLENKYNFSDYSINNLKNIENSYSQSSDTNFGVKIVDNYTGKIMVKTTDIKNINKNYDYEVLFIDENYTTSATLDEIVKDNDNTYLIFTIKNGLEKIINKRTINIKIKLRDVTGLSVNNNLIKTVDDIDYVTVYSLNMKTTIPIKRLIKLENESIVTNYEKEELDKLNIKSNDKLNIYDRIIEK